MTMFKAGSGAMTAGLSRERLVPACDWLAAALAASLPWSTSATGILAALWVLAAIPTLDWAAARRVTATPAGGLPVLLWAFGLAGMGWADVPLAERLNGLSSFHKLLMIPLLIIHFERSDRGSWVVTSFLWSCGTLLALSWATLVLPAIPGIKGGTSGIPVKDYISQSAMFGICIAIAIDLALSAWRQGRGEAAFAWAALALAFLANILLVATSRTAFVALPVLLVLFGLKRFGWKGAGGVLLMLLVLAGLATLSSQHLRDRFASIPQEVRSYLVENGRTSAGERLEYWKKSVVFISRAPVIGHGTGSITEQFRRAVSPDTETSALVAANPHNQTLAVAIQLGLLGAIVLYAMWIAHCLLFRGAGLAAWAGLAVVVQNFVGSIFNSHLFDFTHGWGYVIGVGVAGGYVLRAAAERRLRGA